VPMREDCKHFQSRTYRTGEVVRFCELDLAPEAPWRCPEDCASYERRVAGAGWETGSLVEPPVEEEPGPGGPEVVRLLEEAEDIVDSVVPETLSEVERDEQRAARRRSPSRRRRWPWSRPG
jgi:hypothetical protein